MRHIRIINTPTGESPEEIRRAWVGLEVPVVKGPKKVLTVGLNGPKSLGGLLWRLLKGERFPRVEGYLVNATVAVGLLEAKQPEAAAWWKQNCPEFLGGRRCFLFDMKSCQEIHAK